MLYSYLFLLVVSFLAASIGLPIISGVGKGLLIVIISAIFAVILGASRDRRIEKVEVVYFLLVVVTLFASFFLTKKYLPELFSAIPENVRQVFAFMEV